MLHSHMGRLCHCVLTIEWQRPFLLAYESNASMYWFLSFLLDFFFLAVRECVWCLEQVSLFVRAISDWLKCKAVKSHWLWSSTVFVCLYISLKRMYMSHDCIVKQFVNMCCLLWAGRLIKVFLYIRMLHNIQNQFQILNLFYIFQCLFVTSWRNSESIISLLKILKHDFVWLAYKTSLSLSVV